MGMVKQYREWFGTFAADPSLDSFMLGARKGAPVMFRHALRVKDMVDEDVFRDPQGRVLLEDLTPSNKLAIASGFNVLDASKKYGKRSLENRINESGKISRKRKATLIAESLLSGDKQRAAKLFTELSTSPENHGFISQDEMLSTVVEEYLSRSKALEKRGTAGNYPARKTSGQVYPSVSGQRQPHVERRLLALQLAQELEQPLLVANQAMALQQGLKQDVLKDSLAQAGLDPAISDLLLKKNIESQRRLAILQEQIGNPSE
jgi:hypothetical protein